VSSEPGRGKGKNRTFWLLLVSAFAFSSGGITEEFDKEFPALHSTATEQLHLLWIACGTDDRLIDINHKFRERLASTLSTWTSRRPARIRGWFGCGT
jgi:hypothetical protein